METAARPQRILLQHPSPPASRFSPQQESSSTPLPSMRTPGSMHSGSPVHQFSPPMFSSPSQPADVPFRTSSATPFPISPVPLPLWSGSPALPTSSPSLYTNGSAELPLHRPAGIDELSFESPYVLFSAHKVLKRKNLANVSSLGFGALVSPGREIAHGPQVVQRDPHRCQNCGAYVNLYCEILLGSGQWQCVICKKLNSSDEEYIASSKEDLYHWPELSSSAIDYVQTVVKRAVDEAATTEEEKEGVEA